MLELTWFIIAPFDIAYDGYSEVWSPRTLVEHLPSAVINVALAVAGAAVYVEVGLAGIAFALAAVLAFSYMAYLLAQSRGAHRAVRVAVVGRAGRAVARARHPRPARRAPCRGRGPVLQRHGRGGRDERAASRSSPTPPACCTTSATSPCPTAWPNGGGR